MTKTQPVKRVTEIAGVIAAGAAVGAVIGVLFAPKSGAAMRKHVGRKAKHAAHRVEAIQAQAGVQLRNTYANLREYVGAAKHRLDRWVKR